MSYEEDDSPVAQAFGAFLDGLDAEDWLTAALLLWRDREGVSPALSLETFLAFQGEEYDDDLGMKALRPLLLKELRKRL